MTYTTNGTHGTTSPPLYTPEEIARLTALGVMFTWDQLDPEDQLERILSTTNPLVWYQRTPDDFLSTLAFFRPIPAQWGRIWEQFAAYKGNPWKLQEAVDDLLRDEHTARAPGDMPDAGGAGKPLVTHMDTVQARQIEWLWYPYIAIGKLCILDGDPGVGKTLFATQLAANVSRGFPMPDQAGTLTLSCGEPGLVIFIATEDDLEDTVKPRLEKAGADCTKVKVFNEWEDGLGKIHTFTLADLPYLDTVLQTYRPRLVYIDAIQAVLGGKVDANRANQLKELLDPLAKLAATYRCAILASRHPAKPGQNNVKLIHRGANSMAIIGTARLGLYAEDHPTDRTKVLLLQTKSNAGAIGRTQIFSKDKGQFEWAGVSHITKEDLAGPAHGPDSRGWLAAYFWLEQRLEGGLAWPASDLEKEATGEEHDLTTMALRRAKKTLGVISRQLPGEAHAGWTWQLPPFPLVPYPSSSTDSFDTTDSTDSTDTPDLKTKTYEDGGQMGSEGSGASDGSDVSVEGVVTGEYVPANVTPLSGPPDCLPPPCAHPETRTERMDDGSVLLRCLRGCLETKPL